jgi:hypothetical protein
MFTTILSTTNNAIVININLIRKGVGGQSGKVGISAGPMVNNAWGIQKRQEIIRGHVIPRQRPRQMARTSTPTTTV